MGITRITSLVAMGVLCLGSFLFAQELIPPENWIHNGEETYRGHVTIRWDQDTGNLSYNTNNSWPEGLSSFGLEVDPRETDWRFDVGDDPDGDGFYDGCAFDKVFFNLCEPTRLTLIVFGIGSGLWPNFEDLGNVVPLGTSVEDVQAVWRLSGGHGGIFRPLDYHQFESTTGLVGPIVSIIPVPEPSTLVLFGVGLLGLISQRRRW